MTAVDGDEGDDGDIISEHLICQTVHSMVNKDSFLILIKVL